MNKGKLVVQLTAMGFSQVMAIAATQNQQTQDLDILVSWIIDNQHREEEFKANQAKGPENKEQLVSISNQVNQQFNAILQSHGHSKNVAEKSLFMTGNKSVEAALQWIEENKGSPDFEQQLFIVGKGKSNLTEEEAKMKAKELQMRLREQRKKKEEEDELERERNRIKGGKEMVQAKRLFDQAQRRRAAELQKMQREKDEIARQKIKQQLERERAERAGKTYVAMKKQEEKKKELSNIELFENGLQQIKTASPYHLYPGKAKTAFDTISIYITNVLKNEDVKFRKINTANKAFQTRVQDTFGGVFTLQAAGFKNEGDCLQMGEVDKVFLQQCLDMLASYSNDAARFI